MSDQLISDAFNGDIPVGNPLLTTEDLEPSNHTQKPASQSDKLSTLAGAAVDVTYGDSEDPYQAYAANMDLDSVSMDVKAGELLIDSVLPELDPNDTASVDIGTRVYEDAAKSGISDELGFEVIGDPDKLKARKKALDAAAKVNDEHNGFLDVAGEFLKSALIPFRDPLFSNALLGTPNLSKMENLVNNYRAATPEVQDKLFDEIIDKVNKVDGYWLEKVGFLDNLVSNSADEDMAMTKLFTGLDLVGAVGDVAALGKIGKILKSKSDVAKAVEAAENAPLAGRMQADALVDEDVAKATGVDQATALEDVVLGNPTANEILKNLPESKSHSTGKSVAFRSEIDKTLAEVKQMLKPATFTGEETAKEIDKLTQEAVAKIEADAGYSTVEQPVVSINRATESGEVELEISYKLPDGSKLKKDGTPDRRRKPIPGSVTITKQLDKTAWGSLEKFEAADITAGVLNPKSPKLKLRSTKAGGTTVSRTVEDAGLVANAQARINSEFNEAFRVATRTGGTSKKDRGLVNQLLSEQDSRGKVLSIDELLNINPKIEQKHIDSYYMQNELFDVMKTMEDDMKYSRAVLEGAEEYNLGGSTLGFGKSFKSLGEDFRRSLQDTHHTPNNLPKEIIDVDTLRPVKTEDVDNYLKTTGKRVVVLDKDEVLATGNTHRIAILDESNISGLRRSSLDIHRVEGYVPRIRQDAKYFVRETVEKVVDGVKVRSERVYAAASKKSEAEAARVARAAEVADPNIDTGSVIEVAPKVQYDREGIGFQSDDMPRESQGLYLGHRATHDIKWLGASGKLDPPDMALAKNMAFVARSIPLNEWRMSMETKWKNSVREAGIMTDPDLRNPLPNTHLSDSNARLLEEHRKYLRGVLGAPDGDTLAWEGWAVRMSEMFDDKFGKVGDAVARAVRRNASTDPVSQVKYLTFHSLLGWFNPSQLIVQASNMATAMSIHPWITMTHMHKAMALRAGLYGSDSGVRKWIAKRINGLDPDELEDITTQFKRAGVDQITTNADMDAAVAGYGTTRDKFSRLADSGLMFYRQGELAGRTVTYTVARQAYMRDNKIKDWRKLTDVDHRRIKEYFDNLSINLGKENKTNFQRNVIAALPTQFLHVTTKFVEMFFGKKFTPQQKMKLVIGQGALFGAAGLPFGEQIAKSWEQAFREPDGTSGSPIDSEVVRQGLLHFITGDVALSSRVGLGNQATETLLSVLKEDNVPMWQKFMGASGTLVGRTGYAATILESFTPGSIDLVGEDALMRVAKAVTGLTSTGNNAEQAYMMYKHQKFISKTKGSYNYDSPTWQEIWGKALGFQSTREIDTWRANQAVVDRQKWLTNKADQFFQIMFNYGIDTHTEEFSQRFKEDLVAWTHIESGFNDHDTAALQKAVWDRIYNSDDKRTKAFAKILKNEMSSRLNPELVTKAGN